MWVDVFSVCAYIFHFLGVSPKVSFLKLMRFYIQIFCFPLFFCEKIYDKFME